MAFKLVRLEKCLLEVSSCRVMLVMMAALHAIHLLLELIEVRIVLVACSSTEHEAPILASLLLISLLVSPLFISCVHADEDELEEEEEGVVEVLTFNTLLGILSILAML